MENRGASLDRDKRADNASAKTVSDRCPDVILRSKKCPLASLHVKV